MQDSIFRIAAKIAEGGKNVVFTGAGISTESGIPDYRSQGGIWDKFRPVYFDEFMSRRPSREEYWRRWVALYGGLVKATPNPAHTAVAALWQAGLVDAVVTQNVDGLHQASGIDQDSVIELHGNTRRIRCMNCRQVVATEDVWDRLGAGDAAPECSCGGYLKPDTVSFGQAMPAAEVGRAEKLSRTCYVFLVIGSTLLVHPAAQMPFLAKEGDAFLAVVNLSETPCDGMADVRIEESAGKVLPAVWEKVKSLRSA